MDDELAAFEAELTKLEKSEEPQPIVAPAGPRAPKVISSAPVRSAPPTSTPTPSVTAAAASVSASSTAASVPSEHSRTSAASAHGAASSSVPTSATPFSMVPPASRAAPMPPMSYGAGPSSSSYAPGPAVPQWPQPPKPAASEAKSTVVKRCIAGQEWEDQTLADWPDDDFRIFVGDMGNETNDDVLAHAFSKYPSFQKARVIKNRLTHKSLGYGFVSFKDPWDMTKALREMQGKYIGNRPVKVRKSTWKERAAEVSTEKQKWSHALSVHNPKQKQKLHTVLEEKRSHVHKKRKGMPW